MRDAYKGFITIEYALILPIVILSFFSMISMALYLYNACLLEQNTCLIALQIRNKIATQEEVDYQDIYDGLYHNKYLLAYDVNSTVKLDNNEVLVESEGSVLMLGIEHIFLGNDSMSLASEISVDERNKYLILHTLKALKNIDIGAVD